MTRPRTYNKVAILLHWLIAGCFVGLFCVGFYMARLGDDALSLKFTLYQWHKSFGITVLLLAVIRLAWRFTHTPPAILASGWQAYAAKAAHGALYTLTLLIPLVGWAMVSASPWNIPTVLFGFIPWPHLPLLPDLADKRAAEDVLKLVHMSLAYGTAFLVLAHAGAAFHHHFRLRDNTLVRVVPFLQEPPHDP